MGVDRQTKGDRRPLAEHEGEQRILRRIERLRLRDYGARRIASTLNRARTLNPRTGGAWAPSTLAALLRTIERRERIAA